MVGTAWLFDVLLVLALFASAWAALTARDLFAGITLFITFGLLMALGWARLGAPDIALAEAAIGAGVTGALLMVTARTLTPPAQAGSEGESEAAPGDARPGLTGRLLAPMVLLAAGLLGWALWILPRQAEGLAGLAAKALPHSGVENAVTAVLLNYRAYDTLLELAVLLAATMGIGAFAAQGEEAREGPQPPQATPVLAGLVRAVSPLIVIISVYLLWRGAYAPGGAFQAGALLGAGGILLLLGGKIAPRSFRGRLARLVAALGLAVFLGAGAGVVVAGQALLEWPLTWAKSLILLLEVAATLSIAAIFTGFFAVLRTDTPEAPPDAGFSEQQP